ncbi:short chain dehydrogenase [Colletotrichum truncatum]|uniref:Short chain dehydrogenase n=1 Tax=Colletotrichum truncatum TaxID=5467 RepID=A0ACC3YPP4_COLTU|nr:short chain dehydrogenase [Colletotrichum truncatum]XP_036577333.1 short chain dehydrogenase [Colletotrichum truncatum]XP_036586518.1 short chain dehydrogenase [Colletotrichum truncatum]KAF6780539.1 short chain dehydrogenase [Colletotrichum truncatum]KAF6784273.1 short chain dehydrogenase [Colletotrichum truncatum]KAF6796925.1 short chain dehydrogenase [Colletotrichum truncatum]
MSSSLESLSVGFSFTKTVHRTPYPAISPFRDELSQTGKTVLITGGHTGIGFAIARAFAKADARRIIIVARRSSVVNSAASLLGTEFPKQSLSKEDIFVDVLVLNAAKLSTQPILESGRDAVWSEYLLNTRTTLDFTERLYRQANSKGRRKAVVNLSSMSIHDTKLTGNQPSYGASKSAGTMLLQRIAKDVLPDDLQILSYHPGGVYTELMEKAGASRDAYPWDHEDLPGQFAVWAASDEAKFLHGRFVWAKWDVAELREGPIRERLDNDPDFLTVGVIGL